MTLNDKIRALITSSPLMLAALVCAEQVSNQQGVRELRTAVESLTDDIEAVVIEELNLVDAEYQTDCAAKIKAQHAGEPTPLTDEEVAFFEVCLRPDLRAA